MCKSNAVHSVEDMENKKMLMKDLTATMWKRLKSSWLIIFIVFEINFWNIHILLHTLFVSIGKN